ncbi:MAG: 50S ribosomal protein L15 [Rhodothermia bacterium]
MDLSNLKYNDGARKNKKRIGRGEGSGRGGTSTKGHKGQKSRAGASIRASFEGGQMPLVRRIPKFGFKNRNRVEYKPINVARLDALVDEGKLDPKAEITPEVLVSLGVIQKRDRVKVLGRGVINIALNVRVHAVSESAKQKIEAAGGSVS